MLTFLFPAWQGAGDQAVYRGALAMQQFTTQLSMIQADISLSDDLEKKNGIVGYDTILKQIAAARLMLERQSCTKMLTLGGGCDAEILPVSYLNRLYTGDLALVWLDAHGDLNIPASSPSGLFHGMPLRCLLGEGDVQLRTQCFSFLDTHQIVLAGGRDYDEPELAYINNHNISCITSQELEDGQGLYEVLHNKGYSRVYVHIDLDVLCPAVFPSVMCPTPGGISAVTLTKTLNNLHAQFEVVGIGIVEYAPERGDCENNLHKIIASCENILA